MARFANNAAFTATAGGTGAFTVASAVAGYVTPAAASPAVVDGQTYRYRAQSADMSQWEWGDTVPSSSGTVWSRTVHGSSNSAALVGFTNPPTVILTFTAEDMLWVDQAQTLTTAQQDQARANLSAGKAPSSWTRTVFTSGSGTYTTKAGCKAIRIRMIGGGGGGGGSPGGAGSGSNGGATTFGTSLLTCSGGGGAGPGGNGVPGGGGASGGDINLGGALGNPSPGAGASSTYYQGAPGAATPFGGGGAGGWNGQPGWGGGVNTGAGGGGGGSATAGGSGSGGGAGGYLEKLIITPAASYAYAVGSGGTGGSAGSGGVAGGAGGSGLIIIDEFY